MPRPKPSERPRRGYRVPHPTRDPGVGVFALPAPAIGARHGPDATA